jgi:hypothetical protein
MCPPVAVCRLKRQPRIVSTFVFDHTSANGFLKVNGLKGAWSTGPSNGPPCGSKEASEAHAMEERRDQRHRRRGSCQNRLD